MMMQQPTMKTKARVSASNKENVQMGGATSSKMYESRTRRSLGQRFNAEKENMVQPNFINQNRMYSQQNAYQKMEVGSSVITPADEGSPPRDKSVSMEKEPSYGREMTGFEMTGPAADRLGWRRECEKLVFPQKHYGK